jgi:hypothetical protein
MCGEILTFCNLHYQKREILKNFDAFLEKFSYAASVKELLYQKKRNGCFQATYIYCNMQISKCVYFLNIARLGAQPSSLYINLHLVSPLAALFNKILLSGTSQYESYNRNFCIPQSIGDGFQFYCCCLFMFPPFFTYSLGLETRLRVDVKQTELWLGVWDCVEGWQGSLCRTKCSTATPQQTSGL